MRSLSKFVVDLDLFKKNLELIYSMSGGHKKLMPMVKAQAYGHGMLPISRLIIEKNKDWNFIEGLGVATVEEAFTLRSQLDECPVNIYIFSELNLKTRKEWYEQWGLIPVLSNYSDLEFFLNCASFKDVPLVLKFNSGMNRLGLNYADLEKIIKLLSSFGKKHIDHLMSHFACSFIYSHPSIKEQIVMMEQVKKDLFDRGFSIENYSFSNSGSIEQNIIIPDETVLRPGIMMYGPNSVDSARSLWKGKIISKLETTVLNVHSLKKNDSFGYGLTKVDEEGFLIVLPLGYADGIQFGFQGYSFSIENVEVKFLARPNMDLCYLWSNDKRVLQWVGKKIQIWSPNDNNLQGLSDHNRSITYQLLTSISSRVPREYALK